MQKIMNILTNISTLYAIVAAIVGVTITVYISYNQVLSSIGDNTDDIEATQILILKPVVRTAERNPCPISDPEWDEYLMNGSLLHELKQNHDMVSMNMPFIPIKRISERTKQCVKYR